MRRRIFPNLLGDVAQLEERQAILERIMQVIGFSPELPYTLTVNDGTLNRVSIGKIGSDYGIQILDNAGNSILLANGTIVANAIKSGTLDCSLITVTNLNAGSITTGTLSATRISGGILNCALITVSNLSAAVINTGIFISPNDRFNNTSIHGDKIMTGTLTANRIVAGTITADRIIAHVITTNELAYRNVDGDYVMIDNSIKNRAIFGDLSADKITAGTLNAGIVNVTNINASNINTGSLIIKETISNLIFQNSGGAQQGSIYGAATYLYINANNGIVMTNDLYFTGGKSIYVDNLISGNWQMSLAGKVLGLAQYLYIWNSTEIGKGYLRSGGDQLNWWNGKSAILPTSKGYKALYCMEAPELWFMDFCDTKDKIDPLFLEVTEGEIKYIKCDDGSYQVWRRRKNSVGRRFEERTEREFQANNVFWNTPRQMAEATEFNIPIIDEL